MSAMRWPRKAFRLVSVLLVSGFLGACDNSVSDKDIVLIQASEVKMMVDRKRAGEGDVVLVIDPRSEQRFQQGHIPGARNMALPPIEAGGRDPGLTPYATLVVAGDDPGDNLARAMAKRLLQLRYKGVRLFAGGMEEWKRLGHPVETGPEPR